MKKLIITMVLLIATVASGINGMAWCGFDKGLYIDVKGSIYEIYRPIETLTNSYIQIDCNE